MGIAAAVLATTTVSACSETPPPSAECAKVEATAGSNGISMVNDGLDKLGIPASEIKTNLVYAGQELNKSLLDATGDNDIQPSDVAKICVDDSRSVITEVEGQDR